MVTQNLRMHHHLSELRMQACLPKDIVAPTIWRQLNVRTAAPEAVHEHVALHQDALPLRMRRQQVSQGSKL